MWAEYRKRLIVTQIVIVILCLILHFAQHYPWSAVLFAFVVLQVFGIMGARWAVRMKGKLAAERPLLRPR
ncbi:MAG TPA: hypothetical protein VGQ99_06770 [Tepidisphaeraceae bacterium]|nr:hypothetical protein [Tepidisphaeraceae bacterium]